MAENVEINELFSDSESQFDCPAFIVYECGKPIPLEIIEEEQDLFFSGSMPVYPSPRRYRYRDRILFVTLDRYTAEKFCLVHKDCGFIQTANLTEALKLRFE